jgi:hypothetical protein
MIYSEELRAVAKRIFWFGTLEEALEFPLRFLTYAMTYASDEDIEVLRKYFSDDDFKAALDDPVPGIFDRSSWAKWNKRYGRCHAGGRGFESVAPANFVLRVRQWAGLPWAREI